MTKVMQDSITVANLTGAADAYLGYVNGRWPTYDAVVARFPGRPVLSMAVFASDDAEGCDVEAGDLAPVQVGPWVRRQQARGIARPVVYASASAMQTVLRALAAVGIPRTAVRLLSAHYGAGKHICGPATCAYPGVPACDGTQWTDKAAGAGGSRIDESVLNDDFFGDNVALSSDDLAAIARAVWNTDGILPNPVDPGNANNPNWTANRMLAATAGQVLGEPDAIITGVLKGLSPADLAAAIATHLGPDVGQQVVTALQKQLAAPAS